MHSRGVFIICFFIAIFLIAIQATPSLLILSPDVPSDPLVPAPDVAQSDLECSKFSSEACGTGNAVGCAKNQTGFCDSFCPIFPSKTQCNNQAGCRWNNNACTYTGIIPTTALWGPWYSCQWGDALDTTCSKISSVGNKCSVGLNVTRSFLIISTVFIIIAAILTPMMKSHPKVTFYAGILTVATAVCCVVAAAVGLGEQRSQLCKSILNSTRKSPQPYIGWYFIIVSAIMAIVATGFIWHLHHQQ